MNKSNLYSLIIVLLLSACINDPFGGSSNKKSNEDIVIKTGTSFGFCLGYCSLDVTITKNIINYISSSRDEYSNPTRTSNKSISIEEWNKLVTLIDMDTFEKLDDVIGCPDCADGGAEWIEIKMGDRKKKVTFEYGNSLEGMKELLNQLRIIRNLYKSPDENEVYLNSFESEQDTVGWSVIRSYMLVNDSAPYSGSQSLYISGGCVQPAASLELNNIPSTSYYVSFWGKAEDKNLSGGITFSNGSNEEPLGVTINNEEWIFFDIGPVQKKEFSPLKIDLIIGGFIPANMFIDNLRVYSLK